MKINITPVSFESCSGALNAHKITSPGIKGYGIWKRGFWGPEFYWFRRKNDAWGMIAFSYKTEPGDLRPTLEIASSLRVVSRLPPEGQATMWRVVRLLVG